MICIAISRERTYMSDRQVDPAAIPVWRVEAAAMAVFAAVGSAMPFIAARSWRLALGIAVSVAIIGLIVAWLWPRARYRHLSYAVDEFGLTIRDGVLWRAYTALPRVRIQHSDVSQGPLQRRFGIATLKLYTAGSRFTKVELEGLRHEEALALRDSLLARAEARG